MAALEGRIADWAAGREAVRAVLLVGSRADPDAEVDALSDHDVLLFVREGSGLLEGDAWVRDFGPVLVMLPERYRLLDRTVSTRLVQYADGSKIDFSLVPADLLPRIADRETLPDLLAGGWRTLLDRDGWTSRFPPLPPEDPRVPARPSEAEFLGVVNEFWWESLYVARFLARREPLRARYSAECVLRFRCLVPMLGWYVEVGRGWREALGPHGGGAPALLDEGDRRRLAATFAGADFEERWEALFAAAEWFAEMARVVAGDLGHAHPDGMARKVSERLRRIREGEGVRGGDRIRGGES